MNVLTEARQDIVDALTGAGIDARTFKPDNIVPPMVVVQAGSPYVQRDATGKTFQDWLVTLEAVLVVPSGSNEREIEDMDNLIVDTLTALGDMDLDTVTVGDYYALAESTAEYLALTITITAWVTI